MSKNLSYQQNAVLARLSENLMLIRGFTDSIRSRASILCTASTALVAIITAARFLPQHTAGFTLESVLLGLVCLCTVGMYWCGGQIWRASAVPIANCTDPTVLYEKYIALDQYVAYNQFLIDQAKAVELALVENKRQGGYLNKMTTVFQTQIGILAFAIAWPGIQSVWGG